VQFGTVETLVLLLIFSVPGAIFLYSYSREFNPYERVTFIQEQFPFEIIILYLITSAIIHSLLIVISLLIFLVSAWLYNNPNILADFFTPFSDVNSANLFSLTISICTIIAYFLSSLFIAYWTGKLWSKRDFGKIPYWCKQIIEMRYNSIRQGEIPIIELTLLNGRKIDGAWHSFSLIDRKQISFEVTIRQVETNQTIWTPSNNIQEMLIKTTQSTFRLLFGLQETFKAEIPGANETDQL
jgi:hypothetical protein